VSRIFMSHANGDARQALALRQWLIEIFLDLDAATGLRAGLGWKDELRLGSARCEAVICLLSANWAASAECKTAYRTAESLGKQILVARLEDLGKAYDTFEWQRCDLFADGPQAEIAVAGGPPVRFNSAALHQLRRTIEGSGIGAESFPWPPSSDPNRAPYRGWEPFEDVDAAVFFGRDASIVRGLDTLRGMRLSGLKSLFVVLGPSGSGKSSYLRAGLISRLRRDDRHFLVLDAMRPQRNALTGPDGSAAVIYAARRRFGLRDRSLGELRHACLSGVDRVVDLLAELRAAAAQRLVDGAGADSAPTLVLPIDQTEELFSPGAGEEAEAFLKLLAGLLSRMNAPKSASSSPRPSGPTATRRCRTIPPSRTSVPCCSTTSSPCRLRSSQKSSPAPPAASLMAVGGWRWPRPWSTAC